MRLSLLALLALAGCSSATVTETQPVSSKLRELKSVQLLITGAVPESTASYFRACLISELCKRELFAKYNTDPNPGQADVKMAVSLSGLRTMSNLELFLLGECAGRAKLTATVTLTGLKPREDLGTFTVHGKSGSYETTYGGIEATAAGVADYLVKQK